MNKKLIYTKALFMSLLILALPVYASKAYAANQLTIVKYSGDNGINGYFDQHDRWIMEVNANIDGDTQIDSSQVKFNNNNFQSCAANQLGSYTCTYTGQYWTIPPNAYSVVFTLTSDAGQTVLTDTKQMIVDNLAPLVEFSGAPVQNGQQVSISYTLRDRAYSTSYDGKCSGLQKVEFLDGAKIVSTKTIDTNECTFTDQATIPLITSDRVIVRAYDKMDHFSIVASPLFELDNTAPDILEETFKIFSDGIEIGNQVTGQPFTADISIWIKENSMETSKVKADFSGLGAGKDIVPTSCLGTGNSYFCEWQDITISIPSSKTANIVINAEDTAGNKGQGLITKSFQPDSVPPVVTYIGTEGSVDEQGYLGSVPNDIIVKLTESGAGLSGKQIYLDLSPVNIAYGSNARADECTALGSEWTCRWVGKVSAKQHGASSTIYLTGARDDAGNTATGLISSTIITDKQAPVVESIELKAFEEVERPTGIIASNDAVVIIAKIRDDSGIRAHGNFLRVYNINGAENLQADCKQTGAVSECVWVLDSVVSGYLLTTVPVTFVDSAGNSKTENVAFEIFAKEVETNPDYWVISNQETTPDALDKELTPLLNLRSYTSLQLSSAQGAETVEIKLGSCSGDTGFLNDLEIFNNQRGSNAPYLMLELKTTEDTANPLNMTCELEIVSLYNRKVSNIEFEEINIMLNFEDNPLGEATDKIEDKIDDLKEKYVESELKYLTDLKKLFHIAEMLCNMLLTWRKITSLLKVVTNIGAKVEEDAPPVFDDAAYAARLKTCIATETSKKTADDAYSGIAGVNTFCKFINCQLTFDKEGQWGILGQMQGWVNTNVYDKMGAGFIKKWTGKDPVSYLNPKDSIAVAILSVCIPGIIYGIEKFRQLQCSRISCLENSLESGVDISACEELFSYQKCKWVVGEIFQFIPYTALFDYYLNMIRGAISDPFSVIGIGLKAGCLFLCPVFKGNTGHTICFTIKQISLLGEIIRDVATIIEKDAWKLQGDYCEELE